MNLFDGVLLAICLLILFCAPFWLHEIRAEGKNIVESYRAGNIYPILKYAQKNYVFYSNPNLDATLDEIFDITLLINVLRADIPAKYNTIDQKKAYLIATNYKDLDDKHEYDSCEWAISGRNYATVPDEVLLEILNNDELITQFAAKYYVERREDVGKYNCIWHFYCDKNELAKKIIEKGQVLWDKHNEKKGAEK